MTTLAEEISEVKQVESQLLRELTKRNKIMGNGYIDDKNENQAVNLKCREMFEDVRNDEIKKCNQVIEDMKSKIFELKKKINRKNIEIGQDVNLQKVKWMRIELKQLMNINSSSSLMFCDNKGEPFDASDMIKELEVKKNKLDNKIQHINHITVL